jgi:hypothetical protein
VVFAINEASTDNVTSDSLRAISVAVGMVHFHTISLDFVRHTMPNPGRAIVQVDGRLYPLYPWAVSLFSVPWVVAVDALHHFGIGHGSVTLLRSKRDDLELQVFSMSIVLAAAAVVVYLIAFRILAGLSLWRRRVWSIGVAVLFLVATPMWSTAGRSEWQHGPSALLLSLALLSALRLEGGEGGSLLLGFFLGFAYAVRPTDVIPLVVFVLWVFLAHRRKMLSTLGGAAIALVPFFVVNEVAYRSLLPPYFRPGGFTLRMSTLIGLAGTLVSPSRGLFIFCPLVVLSIVGVVILFKTRGWTLLWSAIALVPILQWLVISSYHEWWGGDSFGPRYFTDLIPFFVILALPAVELIARGRSADNAMRRHHLRRLLLVFAATALVWSVFVESQGALLRSAWCWNAQPSKVGLSSRVWSWSDPQFLLGFRRLVWGPDRSTELVRDPVVTVGCPSEPVRP